MAQRRTIGILMDYHIPGVVDGAGAYGAEHDLRIDSRWSVRADWTPDVPGWDAVITHVIDMEDAFRRVEGQGLPMVHLNETLGAEEMPRLATDYRACARMAVEEFHRLGLEWVAVPDWGDFPVELAARREVSEIAGAMGLKVVRLHAWQKSMTWLVGVAAMARELAVVGNRGGLFLPHAGVAFSLLDALEDCGVRVPEDLAMIVIDKDVQRTAELAPVPLSAVMLDEWQQGYEAAAVAHRMMDGDEVTGYRRRIAPVGLARRKSTGGDMSRDPMVAKALFLIRNELGGIEGVAGLAERVGVSRRTLEMRFRRETGSTVHATLTARRMEVARRLLRKGGQTVAQVAEILGFSSVHYFTTAFKREVGMTPGAYRTEKG